MDKGKMGKMASGLLESSSHSATLRDDDGADSGVCFSVDGSGGVGFAPDGIVCISERGDRVAIVLSVPHEGGQPIEVMVGFQGGQTLLALAEAFTKAAQSWASLATSGDAAAALKRSADRVRASGSMLN